MPEVTKQSSKETTKSGNEKESTTLHTCACGETHEDTGESHRDECTSTLKFGDTCCCGSNVEKGARTPCGHGPRCH